MYTLVTANLISNQLGAQWQTVDIGSMVLSVLFTNYRDGYITLTNPELTGPLYLNISDLKQAAIKYANVGFVTWLAFIGNAALPATNAAPVITTRTILYSDATQAGYNAMRVNPTYPDLPGTTIASRSAAYLTKAGVPVPLLQSSVLTTVNGLLHLNIPHAQGLMILDASKSLDLCNQNQIGLISFAKIGTVQQIAITADMITSDTTYLNSLNFYIRTGLDLTGKSAMMSLGGYLHCNDTTYAIIDYPNGVIEVKFWNIDMLKRVLDSFKIIDLASAITPVGPQSPGCFSVADIMSPAVLIQYLQLSQSFVIVVNTPSLYVQQHQLRATELIGTYDAFSEPLYPYIDTVGKLREYWSIPLDGLWTLSVLDNIAKRYAYETTEWRITGAANDVVPPDGYTPEQGYLLEIGTQVRT
jgi:hypothetical protein